LNIWRSVASSLTYVSTSVAVGRRLDEVGNLCRVAGLRGSPSVTRPVNIVRKREDGDASHQKRELGTCNESFAVVNSLAIMSLISWESSHLNFDGNKSACNRIPLYFGRSRRELLTYFYRRWCSLQQNKPCVGYGNRAICSMHLHDTSVIGLVMCNFWFDKRLYNFVKVFTCKFADMEI
jgi:hypothetical protein